MLRLLAIAFALFLAACGKGTASGTDAGSGDAAAHPDAGSAGDGGPASDAGAPGDAGNVEDGGAAADAGGADGSPAGDAGSGSDGGSAADAGPDAGADAGAPDAESLYCNDGFHPAVDAVRAGSVPPGATVLGLANPTESATLRAGDVHSGDYYLFNQATLTVVGGAGGPTRLSGSVFLADQAAFKVTGADLAIDQGYSSQYSVLALDDSQYSVLDSKLSLGTLPDLLQPLLMCGRSKGEIRRTDLTVRQPCWLDPFVEDRASFAIDSNVGRFELSLVDGGSADVLNEPSPNVVGMYFTLQGLFASPLVLPPSPAAPIVIGPGANGRSMTANIVGTAPFYGLWIEPGTQVKLQDTTSALFLSFHGNGSASGLSSGVFTGSTLTTSAHTVDLVRTTVPILNAYEDGGPGTLSLAGSTLGEHTCNGPVGTECDLSGDVVDGSGGNLGASVDARLVMTSGSVGTNVVAKDRSRMRFTYSYLQPSTSHPAPYVQALADAVVSLEDCALSTSVALTPLGNGAIAEGWIFAPAYNASVTGSVVVSGNARVLSAAASPNAFASWALSWSTAGGTTRTPIASGTAPVAWGLLGTWNTTGLAPGAYELHLVVNGSSGVLADVLHPVTVQ